MNKVILGLVLTVMSASALGAVRYEEFEECWEPPTEREDGTPLTLEEIRGYKIFLEIPGAAPIQLGGEFPNNVTCVKYVPNSASTICLTGTTIDTGGRESAVSDQVCVTPVAIITPPKRLNWKSLLLRVSSLINR